MRTLIGFDCAGDRLAATLDQADGRTGLLIVSGGNEIRIGAHRGMARLAQRVAAAGHPVLRFDRRGIGDSDGINRGFLESAPDIAAAAAAFRRHQPIERILGFGNCDAASALALFHRQAGIDALLLANPWVIEQADSLPPASAIRARYADRLRDPRQWLRLARGGVDIPKLVKGLAKTAQPSSEHAGSLAAGIADALKASDAPATILLAERDNTAIAFQGAWHSAAFAPLHPRIPLQTRDTASHGFAREGDADWLFDRVIDTLTDRHSHEGPLLRE